MLVSHTLTKPERVRFLASLGLDVLQLVLTEGHRTFCVIELFTYGFDKLYEATRVLDLAKCNERSALTYKDYISYCHSC